MHLVLLHGMGQTAASWQETILNLPNEWQIHCPELFKTEEAATYNQLYKEFVQECEKYPAPFHLGGISLGAVMACQYAIQYPKKVKSLLLIAVQLKPPLYLLKFQQFIFSLLPKSYFKKHNLNKEQLLLLCRSLKNLNLKTNLQQIQCPAIAICGGKDYFNQQASEEFIKDLVTAQYAVIEQAGHEVNIEKPMELAIVINRFLKEASRKNEIGKEIP